MQGCCLFLSAENESPDERNLSFFKFELTNSFISFLPSLVGDLSSFGIVLMCRVQLCNGSLGLPNNTIYSIELQFHSVVD